MFPLPVEGAKVSLFFDHLSFNLSLSFFNIFDRLPSEGAKYDFIDVPSCRGLGTQNMLFNSSSSFFNIFDRLPSEGAKVPSPALWNRALKEGLKYPTRITSRSSQLPLAASFRATKGHFLSNFFSLAAFTHVKKNWKWPDQIRLQGLYFINFSNNPAALQRL
jgi:hypothetical protein